MPTAAYPEPWPNEPDARPIGEVLRDFDQAASGTSDIDIRSVLWELLRDTCDSYSAALAEQTTLSHGEIAQINTTVADYLTNTYS